MASTLTVTNSIDWSRPFLRFLPLTIGVSGEPAISTANLVKQIILGPPFCWRWNRANATPFTTIATPVTRDYSRPISDFGFLEKASLTLGTKTFEVPVNTGILGAGSEQSQPNSIAAQIDDNAGNITFRFLAAPDQIYTANLIYQKKPTLITAVGDTWDPIPDELSFVYNQGFLAFSALYADDARWTIQLQRFLASLIGVSQGLDESQKNAFIEGWLMMAGQSQSSLQKTQIGTISRNTLK